MNKKITLENADGSKDYTEQEVLLRHMDEILRISGVEDAFFAGECGGV